MDLKDRITTTVALIALVLSTITAYFQFFHAITDVKVRVALHEIYKDKIDYDVIIFNRGTEEFAIPWIYGLLNTKKSGEYGRFSSNSLIEPFVVKGGEIKALRLTFLIGDIEKAINTNKQVYFGLQISTIDSDGNQSSGYFFPLEVWRESETVKRKSYEFYSDLTEIQNDSFQTINETFRVSDLKLREVQLWR